MMSEGFSAANYFKVNRGLVTSIAGYLLTYIIVLMQFKISDVSVQHPTALFIIFEQENFLIFFTEGLVNLTEQQD
jgi:hypothetical protein